MEWLLRIAGITGLGYLVWLAYLEAGLATATLLGWFVVNNIWVQVLFKHITGGLQYVSKQLEDVLGAPNDQRK